MYYYLNFFACFIYLIPGLTGESVVSESTLRNGDGDRDTSVDKEGEGEGEGASTVASTEQSEAVTQETR
jgi:hypothetical protein